MDESKKSRNSESIFIFSSVYLAAGIGAAATILLTSDLTPLGRIIYSLIAKADPNPAGAGLHPYQVSLGICLLLIFLGYLVDIHLWRRAWFIWPFVKLYQGALGVCSLAAALLYSSEAPSIPPLLGIGMSTWAVYLIRRYVRSGATPEEFSAAAAASYAGVGMSVAVLWIVWVFTGWMGLHTWDWDEEGRLSVDTEHFVRWCSPFVVALIHILISLFLRMRSRMLMIDDLVLAELKLICSLFVLLVLMSWLAASVAAGDAGLSKVVLRLSIILSVGAAGYLLLSLGPEKILSVCEKKSAFSILMPLVMSDWAKSAFVLVCSPLLPVYFAVEIFHMKVRKVLQSTYLTHWERSKMPWITNEGAYVVEKMSTWHTSTVLLKCMWLGVAFFTVQVGCGRGIVVFLAWICEQSLGFSLPAIMGILYGIGVTLFLLPPVPGCPIYMVSSILITKRFEATGRHFLLASLVALILSMVIKLSAVAMQQKLIGEPFSHSLFVKKLVGIHTPEMKAIRYILSQPGLHTAKVAVLVNGPDWPTSVFTGILKLPLLQMLLGTLPVALLIAPFTLSGSFMVHCSSMPENSTAARRYAGLSNALVFFAMLCQMGGMVLIAQYTHATLSDFKDEIERGDWMKDEQEEEVLRGLTHDEEKSKERRERTVWSVPSRAITQHDGCKRCDASSVCSLDSVAFETLRCPRHCLVLWHFRCRKGCDHNRN